MISLYFFDIRTVPLQVGCLELVNPSLRRKFVQNSVGKLIRPIEEWNEICKITPNKKSFKVMLSGEFSACRGPHLVSYGIDQPLNVVLIAIVNDTIIIFQSQKSFHLILQDNLRLASDEFISVLQRKMHLLDGYIGLISLRVLPEELQL